MDADWALAIAAEYGAAHKLRTKRQVAALKSWAITSNRRGAKGGSCGRKLQAHCEAAQHRWINKSQRKRDQQLAPIPTIGKRPCGRPRSTGKEKICGRGKWKQLLPEEVQRNVFVKGTIAFRNRSKSAHGYLISLAQGCSAKLLKLESDIVCTYMHSCRYVIFSFTCDTASYRFLYGKRRGKACDSHLLGLVGRLLFGLPGRVEEDDYVSKAVAVESNTATCQWSAYEATMPTDLFNLLNGKLPTQARMAAVCMGADEHSVNKMVGARLQQIAATNDRLLVMAEGWCKQHGTGNVLQPVVEKLGILPPAFCISKKCAQTRSTEPSSQA